MNLNLKEFLPKRILGKQPDFILWSSTAYFNHLASQHIDPETLQNSLNWDLITFLHEYVGLKDKKIYPYGEYGIMDAYHLPTSEICKHHELELEAQGLKTLRAKLETQVALNLEAWMTDSNVPIGEKFITISPRGHRNEGYPGVDPKNYVFINVHQKTNQDEFQLIQYTSYDLNDDLVDVQNSLISKFDGKFFGKNQTPQTNLKNSSHYIISRQVILSPFSSLKDVEALIYKNEFDEKKGWAVTRQELPQVDEVLFNQEMERILELLLKQFWNLAKLTPNSAIIHFDLLIDTVRKHFLKWVEMNAKNYNNVNTGEFTPSKLNIEQILEHWQLQVQHLEEKRLDREQKNQLKTLVKNTKLNPSLPLNRLSSMAHCVVGSPGNLVSKSFKLSTNFLSLKSPEFINLSTGEKKSLLEKIESENMTEIILENGNHWMVPVSFLEGKGCYISEDGIDMGPCDVPLADSFAFKMTKEEFFEFKRELQKQTMSEDLDSATKKALENLAGEDEKQTLMDKVEQIKKLIFKQVVSVTELIAGDLIVSSDEKNKHLGDIIKILKTCPNPIAEIDKIIFKMGEKVIWQTTNDMAEV